MSIKKNGILSFLLLGAGIALSTRLHHLGVTEWSLLLVFGLLGLCVGITTVSRSFVTCREKSAERPLNCE